MTLLALVSRALEAHGVAHAVIGAAALAVHGVSRATADIDLLVTDPRGFDSTLWAPVEAAGAAVDMRRGDADDPLAGVIRISRGEDPPVDVIAGRSTWQTAIMARAVPTAVAGATVPIAALAGGALRDAGRRGLPAPQRHGPARTRAGGAGVAGRCRSRRDRVAPLAVDAGDGRRRGGALSTLPDET